MLDNLDNSTVRAYAKSVKERKKQLIVAILECVDLDTDDPENLQEMDSYLQDYVLLDLAYIKLVELVTD